MAIEPRTKELEESNILSKLEEQGYQGQSNPSTSSSLSSGTTTIAKPQSSVEIEDKSFEQNSTEVKKQSDPSKINEKARVTTISQDDKFDEQTKKEMEDIRQIILALNDEYMDSKIEGRLDLDEFWSKELGRAVQELTTNRRYRKIIGNVNADILERNIIKITSKIKEFREANAIEDNLKAKITRNEAELYINSIFRTLDDIYGSIEGIN